MADKSGKYPNLTASHFSDHENAVEGGKKSKRYSKYKWSILQSLGYRECDEKTRELLKLSKKDFDEIIKFLLLSDFTKIKEIADEKRIPAFVKVMSRGIVKDAAKGDMRNVKDILDRLWGKPEQKIENEISGKDGGPVELAIFKYVDKDDKEIKS